MFLFMEFIIFFFFFIPEIYLSLSILIFLLFNVIVVNISKLNYPVLKLEIFSQAIIILVCLFFLLLFRNVLLEQQDSVPLVQCKVFLSLPCFFPKTKNKFKLVFHQTLRSVFFQKGLVFFSCFFSYWFCFKFIWSVEPLVIIGVFYAAYKLDCFIESHQEKISSLPKVILYTFLAVVIFYLLVFGSTFQVFRTLAYLSLILLIAIFKSLFGGIAKLLYGRSPYFDNILKNEVEANQVIDLHMWCDLPLVKKFFKNSFRGILFLWFILVSSGLRFSLGISDSGQLYALSLLCFFFFFRLLFHFYVLFGFNLTLSESLNFVKSFIIGTLKYTSPIVGCVALFGIDNPHKTAEIISEDLTSKAQHYLGVRPNVNPNHEKAISTVFDLNYQGATIDFDQIRDPKNPYIFNLEAIKKANTMVEKGTGIVEAEVWLHGQCTSKPGIEAISKKAHEDARAALFHSVPNKPSK